MRETEAREGGAGARVGTARRVAASEAAEVRPLELPEVHPRLGRMVQ